MLDENELVEVFKQLRSGPGLSNATPLHGQRDLLYILGTDDPEVGLERLRDAAVALGDGPNARACRNALAIGYSAERNLGERRKMAIDGEGDRAHFGKLSRSTLERWEEAGFHQLAQLLLDRAARRSQLEVARVDVGVSGEIMLAEFDKAARGESIPNTTPPTQDEPPEPASAPDPEEAPSSPRSRRVWLIPAVIVAAVAVAIAAVFIPWPGTEEQATTTPSTGTAAPAPDPALMAKYDGHDPRGSEPDNRPGVVCVPPPSEPVEGGGSPPVIGPEGKVVGVIRLRRSPLCSTIWARVLWNDDENALYKVPDGWTLHVVIHRPSTHTEIDAPEPEAGKPPNATPIQFGLSRMLTTQPGCIFAEAYFTKDNMRTNIAVTSCVS